MRNNFNKKSILRTCIREKNVWRRWLFVSNFLNENLCIEII